MRCYHCGNLGALVETWDGKRYHDYCAREIWGRTVDLAVKPIRIVEVKPDKPEADAHNEA